MKNGDTPAQPTPKGILEELADQCVTESTGVTKREHFAAMVMQGLMANSSVYRDGIPSSAIAKQSLATADALLKALEEE